MKFKKIAAILLVLVIALTGVFAQSISEVYHGEYEGRTVILHSNDTHGALMGFSKMATLRKYFEHEGAAVLVVDDGDFTQGNPYVSLSKGASAQVSVHYRKGTNTILDNVTRNLTVVKEDGPKVWLGDGSGQGLIIKK